LKNLTLLLLTLLLSAGLPLGASGQDVDQVYYDAATAWVNLVMLDGDFEAAAAEADPAVAGQLTAQVLEDTWLQLRGQLGALETLVPKSQEISSGYHIVTLAGQFAQTLLDVRVVMNDDRKVGGFFLMPPS
jgi:hypothetical protein